MDPADRVALEARIAAACKAGDKRAGATALLEGYGAELLGFLLAHLRDHDAAGEVFSQFTEDLWRGLDGFRWQCSARVWSYTLIRNAATRYGKDARKRRGRHVPLSHAGPLSQIAEKVRTATLAGARTDARGRMAKLRESLRPDDQMLLVLRVNRKLGWKEIARVMWHEGEDVDDAVLETEAVRLRQRYQAVKERLRRLAEERGIGPDGGDG
jgi:RNA polymerase sigma-70 factor (ECF subfamily)